VTAQDLAEQSFAIAFVGLRVTIESAIVDYAGSVKVLTLRFADGTSFELRAGLSDLQVVGPQPDNGEREAVIWAQREPNTLPVRIVVER
jgi:hypothetical protein